MLNHIREKWFVQDLREPVEVRHCEDLVFSGDNNTYRIGVVLRENGGEPALNGSVVCKVTRPDQGTVEFTGTLDGAKVSAVLPQAALAYPGVIAVVLQLVSDTDVMTVLKALFTNELTSTDAQIDPGSAVPDLAQLLAKLTEMTEGTTRANTAAAAAESAASDANTAAASAANSAAAAAQSVVDVHFPATGRFVTGSGTVSADYATTEGQYTTASGEDSHAEGNSTTASGDQSHAEGMGSTASGTAAHAESGGEASGDYSHAEGYETAASGDSSHAEGQGTIANHASQHVFGEYNTPDGSEAESFERGNYVEIVGNGTGTSDRSNARTLDWSGNEELAGDLTVNKGGANEAKVSDLAAAVAGLPKIQYGTGTTDSSTGILDVEFGTPFSEAPVVILTPRSGTNSNVANTARLVSVTASGFRCIAVSVSTTSSSQTVTIRPDTNRDIRWLAIGT